MTDTSLSDRIQTVLSTFKVPESSENLVSAGLVSGLSIKDGAEGAEVRFVLAIDPTNVKAYEALGGELETVLGGLSGVASARVVLTAHKKAQPAPAKPRFVLAVASGKGGVGKSTTSVNLAVAFAAKGLKVGLLDADIYGPSVPRLLGVAHNRPEADDNKKIQPIECAGLRLMSMGFMVAEDVPIAWRGPMIHGALKQLLNDVAWGELDLLVVDMPPGTGDVHLTLANEAHFAGAVIVSTPQDIALLDAGKSLSLFQKMNVPVLGVIENMSGFVCPHCGETSAIFGHGGAKAKAEKMNVSFLGEVPLTMDLRETSDAGTPIVLAKPEGPEATTYRALADKIWAKLEG